MKLVKNIVRVPVSFSKFLREVRLELKKVTWSTKEELIANTIVVLIGLTLLTIYIALIDWVLSKSIQFILR